MLTRSEEVAFEKAKPAVRVCRADEFGLSQKSCAASQGRHASLDFCATFYQEKVAGIVFDQAFMNEYLVIKEMG